MTRKFKKAIRSYDQTVAKADLQITGVLGLTIGGSQVVEVPGRNAFVYVRLHDNMSEVIQVFNDKVSPSYDLPVIIVRRGNRYEILGRDTQRYNDWGDYSAYLPRHGHTHEMDIEGGGFGDPVFTYSRQFMPYVLFPSGTMGAPDLVMSPHVLQNPDKSWRYIGLTGTPNLTPTYNPPTGTQAVMVTIYLDAYTGNPGILVGSGSYFSETITGTPDVLPYVPIVTNPMYIPLGAVRLVTGSLALSWDNIYDLRQFIHFTPTGSGGGGLSSMPVYNTGSLVGNADQLDFQYPLRVGITGSHAYPYLDGVLDAIEDVTAQIPTGTPVNHYTVTGTIAIGTESLYYNGLRQQYPNHYTVDLNGHGFSTSFTGTYGDTLVIKYGNLGSQVPSVTVVQQQAPALQDEGVPLGNPTIYNFEGDHLQVSVSGSNAQILSPSTGSYGTYTPFCTGITNVTSLTPTGPFLYIRHGSLMQVAGALSIDPTAAGTVWVYFSLPIASNLAQTYDVIGTAGCGNEPAGSVSAQIADNLAHLIITPASALQKTWYINFMYRLL